MQGRDWTSGDEHEKDWRCEILWICRMGRRSEEKMKSGAEEKDEGSDGMMGCEM